VRALLEKAVVAMPTPMIDAANMVHRCEDNGYGFGLHGGYTMGNRRIRISSREVHELLAGIRPFSEFEKSLGWDNASSPRGPSNPFAMRLTEGEMLESVAVIDGGDEDDDFLEFTFRRPDPAISPFVARGDGDDDLG
jgi:hypothetical protein